MFLIQWPGTVIWLINGYEKSKRMFRRNVSGQKRHIK